jgi:hypothetical protein
MSPLIIVLIVLFVFGGGSYFYGNAGAYPYRSYALPGVGTLLLLLLVLYVLHVI